ncbi:MAG: putative prolyl oligopeptidase family protein, partial [Acidobacteriaceae bacterium]|nr:putative prolyl oligopeptidase family protein [Acidobacteriaceae bacterium]
PFGKGLPEWFKRSPEFRMDKVTAPVQVVASGRASLMFEMLEPYAALRYLNKPVDLTVLREGTHVLTNPAERMASQGGTVDWFRFWLMDEEDPTPSKSKQYARWHSLRELQEHHTTPSQQVSSEAVD